MVSKTLETVPMSGGWVHQLKCTTSSQFHQGACLLRTMNCILEIVWHGKKFVSFSWIQLLICTIFHELPWNKNFKRTQNLYFWQIFSVCPSESLQNAVRVVLQNRDVYFCFCCRCHESGFPGRTQREHFRSRSVVVNLALCVCGGRSGQMLRLRSSKNGSSWKLFQSKLLH